MDGDRPKDNMTSHHMSAQRPCAAVCAKLKKELQ